MNDTTLIRELDEVFSKYICLRDAKPNGTFQCISCGKILPLKLATAGHFFSKIHMCTRFNEYNVNAECCECNNRIRVVKRIETAERLINYYENLTKKIGKSRMERLEIEARIRRPWSEPELRYLIAYYGRKCEELQKEKNL